MTEAAPRRNHRDATSALLRDSFEPHTLRRFLEPWCGAPDTEGTDGDGPIALALGVCRDARRREELFAALWRERPELRPRIEEVAALWSAPTEPDVNSTRFLTRMWATEPRKTPPPSGRYDVFIAHAGRDTEAAIALHVLLDEACEAFLDARCLLLGDDWPTVIRKAQLSARMTVAIVPANAGAAKFFQEEVLQGIHQERSGVGDHRLVPVYLEGRSEADPHLPTGLRLHHGIRVEETRGLKGVAERILQDLRALEAAHPRPPSATIVPDSPSAGVAEATPDGLPGRYLPVGLADIQGARLVDDRLLGVRRILVPLGAEGPVGLGLASTPALARGVVQVHDVLVLRGQRHALVSPPPGSTLWQWLATHGPFTPLRAVQVVKDLLATLHEIHAAGLAHGSLCPRCVWVGPDDRVMIGALPGPHVDRDARDPEAAPWLAPECTFAGTSPRPASDVYSAGQILRAALTASAPPWSDAAGAVTVAAEAAVLRIAARATELAPSDRYSSARAMWEALDELGRALAPIEQATAPPPRRAPAPRPPPPPPPPPRPAQPQPARPRPVPAPPAPPPPRAPAPRPVEATKNAVRRARGRSHVARVALALVPWYANLLGLSAYLALEATVPLTAWVACAAGHHQACRAGAELAAEGFVLRRPDAVRALRLHEQGCLLGEEVSCLRAAQGHQEGRGTLPDDARAARWYERGCQLDDARSCYEAGVSHRRGRGVPEDPGGAAERYERACELGSAAGCNERGWLAQNGLGVSRDDVLARELFTRACERGSLTGCVNEGWLYANGRGVARDPARAARLYQQGCSAGVGAGCGHLANLLLDADSAALAADEAVAVLGRACDAGDAGVCRTLGILHDRGAGEDDATLAASRYDQACARGHAGACDDLADRYRAGRGVELDAARAASLYEQACDGGNARGCHMLGWLHQDGEGVPVDRVYAAALYERACDAGFAAGCVNLGWSYQHGAGVPADPAWAARLYEIACEQGNAGGCEWLGTRYHAGEGVPRDVLRAAELFEVACDRGQASACVNLVGLGADARGVPLDRRRVAALYAKACDAGHAAACNNLGFQYHEGDGVPLDEARSASLYEEACHAGEPTGCHNLGVKYETGEGVPADEARAITLYEIACAEGSDAGCDQLGLTLVDPAELGAPAETCTDA